ncbi:sigmaY antisigma factor component [Clostridium sp.]|uniref:sigmaY antisigma factor component n=1 Tax=Clostridium sp. TaxID=1506 RepID=UPI002FC90515
MGATKNEIVFIVLIAIPILLIQGSWIFYDARKRKEKYYWLWGLFGLINAPSSLLVYLIITRAIGKERSK